MPRDLPQPAPGEDRCANDAVACTPVLPTLPAEPASEPRSCAPPEVLCVDGRAAGGAADGSAERPYSRIGDAIAVARAGAVIQVAAGLYPEHVVIRDRGVNLIGGFPGDGEFLVRNAQQYQTTLEGQGRGPVVLIESAPDTRIEGFRITGGTGRCTPDGCRGGGVWAEGDRISIARNVIVGNVLPRRSNTSDVRGGGVYAEGAILIHGNVVSGNRGGAGAGIYGSSRVVISSNRVVDNVSFHDHGGGMYLGGPDIRIIRNIVMGNRAGDGLDFGWGGGFIVVNEGTRFISERNIVTGNSAPSAGSGVFIDDGADGTMSGDLIFRNACAESAAAILVDSLNNSGENGSVVEIVNATIADHNCGSENGGNAFQVQGAGSRISLENSIVWNNGDTLLLTEGGQFVGRYNLSDAVLPGQNQVSGPPLFVNPLVGDYHLQSAGGRYQADTEQWIEDAVTSPAIDAGDPSAAFARETTPNGARLNLGAYGNTEEASRSTR